MFPEMRPVGAGVETVRGESAAHAQRGTQASGVRSAERDERPRPAVSAGTSGAESDARTEGLANQLWAHGPVL